MTREHYDRQIERLKNQWPNSYSPERMMGFWYQLSKFSDEFMTDAVSEFIANSRSAPLLNEFLEYQEQHSRRKGFYHGIPHETDIASLMQKAYNPADYSDPDVRERIQGRINLVKQYSGRLITRRQFDEGCDYYDRAAGIIGD